MHGFCNCSVGASVFFLHDPSKSNKTNNVSYVNGDHESTHFYELLPSCSSKNTSSNASKRPPAGGVVWWVFQLGDCDHCRRDVFGPYILVWRGDENKQKMGVKNVGPLFLAQYEFPPALMLFSYYASACIYMLHP